MANVEAGSMPNTSAPPRTDDTTENMSEDHTVHVIVASFVIAVSVVIAMVAAVVFYRKRKKMEKAQAEATRSREIDTDGQQDSLGSDIVVGFEGTGSNVDVIGRRVPSSSLALQSRFLQDCDVRRKSPHPSPTSPSLGGQPSSSDVTATILPRASSPSLELSNLSGLEVSQDSVFDRLDDDDNDNDNDDQNNNETHHEGGKADMPDILIGKGVSAEFLPGEIRACSSISTGFPTEAATDDPSVGSSEVRSSPSDRSRKRKQGVCVLTRKSSGRNCFSTSLLHPDIENESEAHSSKDKRNSWCDSVTVQNEANDENHCAGRLEASEKSSKFDRHTRGDDEEDFDERSNRAMKLIENSAERSHEDIAGGSKSGKSPQGKTKCFSIKGAKRFISENSCLQEGAAKESASQASKTPSDLRHDYFLVEPEADVTETEETSSPSHVTPARNEYFLVEPESELPPALDPQSGIQCRVPLAWQQRQASSSHQPELRPADPYVCRGAAWAGRGVSPVQVGLDPGSGIPGIGDSAAGRRDLSSARHATDSVNSRDGVPTGSPRSPVTQPPSTSGGVDLGSGSAALPRHDYFQVEPDPAVHPGTSQRLVSFQGAMTRSLGSQAPPGHEASSPGAPCLQRRFTAGAASMASAKGEGHKFTQHRHPSRHAWASVRVGTGSHGGSSESMRREEGPQIVRLKKSMSEPGERGSCPVYGEGQSTSRWEGQEGGRGRDDGVYDRLLFPSALSRPRLRSAPGQMSMQGERLSP